MSEYKPSKARPGEFIASPRLSLPRGLGLADMVNAPLVSVVIPTRNRPYELAYAVSSVLRQTYTNWEIVVVNDGSEERFKEQYSEFLAAARQHVEFHRMRHIWNDEHKGQAACLNQGIAAAQGAYITVLNDDDILLPSALEQQLSYLLLNDEFGFVYGDYYWATDFFLHQRGEADDEDIRGFTSFSMASPRPEPFSFERLKETQSFHAIGLYRADLLKAVPWDTTLKHQEDWDFLLKVSAVSTGCYLAGLATWAVRLNPAKQKSESDSTAMDEATKTVVERINAGYYDRKEWLAK